MLQTINDVFIMPKDGKCPRTSNAETNYIVAMGSDGEFYAAKSEASNTPESLSKAVHYSEKILDAKKINLANWQKMDKEFVEKSYPYSIFKH